MNDTMSNERQEPFVVQEDAERKLAIVIFAEKCYHHRTKDHEDKLAALVERFDFVACDLSRTDAIASEWLRWLARLSARARAMSKRLYLVGVKDAVLTTTDVLGLKAEFMMVNEVAEGLGA